MFNSDCAVDGLSSDFNFAINGALVRFPTVTNVCAMGMSYDMSSMLSLPGRVCLLNILLQFLYREPMRLSI